MSLADHFRELRLRLMLALIGIGVMTVVAAIFYQHLYRLLLRPVNQAMQNLAATHPDVDAALVNIGIPAPMMLAIKLCLVAGVVGSAPWWIYQVWAFIAPGLLRHEKKWALAVVGICAPLFLGGVFVGYWVMPTAITFMLSFIPESAGVNSMVDLPFYLDFLVRLMLVFGIAMVIPVFVVLLNFVGVIPAAALSRWRSFVIFGCFVFAAVATPGGDPLSMLALALPMALLFLIAELIARIHDRRSGARLREAQ
ncbi:MAG: twin-arginine translocase subunit TatC [Propionibacterium sp.]|nr:twin-arginine translocase subunit TatC [Propionibacterium sp.]